jgi:hypothetical protein
MTPKAFESKFNQNTLSMIKYFFMVADNKLTNLHQLFRFNLEEKQLIEIRRLLASCFSEQATTEMDKRWEANNWNADTMKKWAKEHTRTPYKP